MIQARVFVSLKWGFHAPGGCALWWLIQPSTRLHILGELAFEQLDEHDLAVALHTRTRALGIGVDAQGFLLARGLAAVAYTVGSPEIVSTRQRKPGYRGETIGDRLGTCGVVVVPADDDRLNGWARCLSLLRPGADGRPALTIDPSCTTLIHAIPASLLDERHEDDIVNESPALTAFRYGAMSRPSPRVTPDPVVIPPGSPQDVMTRLRDQRAGRAFGQAR